MLALHPISLPRAVNVTLQSGISAGRMTQSGRTRPPRQPEAEQRPGVDLRPLIGVRLQESPTRIVKPILRT
jgi:hypothetical protein